MGIIQILCWSFRWRFDFGQGFFQVFQCGIKPEFAHDGADVVLYRHDFGQAGHFWRAAALVDAAKVITDFSVFDGLDPAVMLFIGTQGVDAFATFGNDEYTTGTKVAAKPRQSQAKVILLADIAHYKMGLR